MAPVFSANDKKYKIMKGLDGNNWVSSPVNDNEFEWRIITDITSIPIKLKYNYQNFLNYYKSLKVDNIIFDYNELLNHELNIRFENELENNNELYDISEVELDSQDIYLYQDDGNFGRYEVDYYAKQFDNKKVIIMTDIELLFASVTDGEVYLYDYNIDEILQKEDEHIFKNLPIVKFKNYYF